MIRLHPIPDSTYTCPWCKAQLDVTGWYSPGMRNLADLHCSLCQREFFGDLRAGQALYTPMLLDKATGEVYQSEGAKWFAHWLGESYRHRIDTPLEFTVEEKRPLKKAVLLNCIDTLYGHSLLKLLNAQYYIDHHPELDLIVLTPKIFRWMVPDGVAAIWCVTLQLKHGKEWNDWLAHEIRKRIEPLDECWLSVAASHPHPNDFNIERFSRVSPFSLEQWANRSPTVTFVWRDDRLWASIANGRMARMQAYIQRGFNTALMQQRQRVIALAERLKANHPEIDFAVAGFGRAGDMPSWILDLRFDVIDEVSERRLCERYAASHVVVGMHGSNMLLPSAHAGATVEIMHSKHWGNILQDILFRAEDIRSAAFRHRVMPANIDPITLAEVVNQILQRYPDFIRYMSSASAKHYLP